jgi:hypothetical protein
LELVPINLQDARAFVDAHHRHNESPKKWKFGVAVQLFPGFIVGVAIAARPVNDSLDDKKTLEISRTCTLGVRNANSMLYGAIVRAGRALGFKKFVTYIQGDETGASLRAAGWKKVADVKPHPGWNHAKRKRRNTAPVFVARERWELHF